MPHPKETMRKHGKIWHLEDTVPHKSAAESLATHLRNTEDKRSNVIHVKEGYQVWWATRHGG